MYISSFPEKGMATHSSILAWRAPWTEEPGRIWSRGLQRVRHNWSDLACTRMHIQFSKAVFMASLPKFTVRNQPLGNALNWVCNSLRTKFLDSRWVLAMTMQGYRIQVGNMTFRKYSCHIKTRASAWPAKDTSGVGWGWALLSPSPRIPGAVSSILYCL